MNCACKGIRTCLICEKNNYLPLENETMDVTKQEYIYCYLCKKGFKMENFHENHHPNHSTESIEFPGIELIKEFITEEEETKIIDEINKTTWVDSQSGRRKQDYGPKVNFKKKKIQTKVFSGFPPFSETLVNRFQSIPLLSDFRTVELCNLEYTPERGSSIDPHFDDFWLWGERLVTLNLNSDTVLSMTTESKPEVEVLILLPRRSLIIVYGSARYDWKHGIHRRHISDKRLAVTFRELTPEFLEGGNREKDGMNLLEIAKNYDGVSVACYNTNNIP